MANFNGIAEFVATVEHRSFTLAAQHTGMTPSGVSKAVARLESRLGSRLLNRTTRRLTLTASGISFYQRCRQILVDLRDAESVVTRDKRLRGTLRLDLAPAFGRLCVMPAIPAFAAQYPDLVLQVVFRAQLADLFDQGVDVALRIGTVSGANVTNLTIGSTRYLTCASPEYFQRFGVPQRPEDLLQHNCLMFVSADTGQIKKWHFSEGRTSFALSVNGNLAMGNTDGLLSAAINGFGIVQLPDFMAMPAVKKTLLQPILKDWTDLERPISVATPRNRGRTAKVDAFIKFAASVTSEVMSGFN